MLSVLGEIMSLNHLEPTLGPDGTLLSGALGSGVQASVGLGATISSIILPLSLLSLQLCGNIQPSYGFNTNCCGIFFHREPFGD